MSTDYGGSTFAPDQPFPERQGQAPEGGQTSPTPRPALGFDELMHHDGLGSGELNFAQQPVWLREPSGGLGPSFNKQVHKLEVTHLVITFALIPQTRFTSIRVLKGNKISDLTQSPCYFIHHTNTPTMCQAGALDTSVNKMSKSLPSWHRCCPESQHWVAKEV